MIKKDFFIQKLNLKLFILSVIRHRDWIIKCQKQKRIIIQSKNLNNHLSNYNYPHTHTHIYMSLPPPPQDKTKSLTQGSTTCVNTYKLYREVYNVHVSRRESKFLYLCLSVQSTIRYICLSKCIFGGEVELLEYRKVRQLYGWLLITDQVLLHQHPFLS